jgi:hypothetical protein
MPGAIVCSSIVLPDEVAQALLRGGMGDTLLMMGLDQIIDSKEEASEIVDHYFLVQHRDDDRVCHLLMSTQILKEEKRTYSTDSHHCCQILLIQLLPSNVPPTDPGKRFMEVGDDPVHHILGDATHGEYTVCP